MASLKSGTTIGGYTAIHTNNISSYALTSAPSVSQLISPNGGTVVGADQAMPSAGHSFIHTLALGPSNNDGHILGMTWSNTTSVYGAQIFIDTDPTDTMAIRSRSSTGVWTSWKTIIHSGNIGSQSVSYATSAGSAGSASSAGSVDGLTINNSGAPINPDNVTQNQIGYNTSVDLFGQSDGGLYSSAYSSSWIHQIYGDFRTGQIAIRGKNNGTWQGWRIVLDDKNIGSYAVPYGNMTSSTGLNDNKLYLRTNGDNNHYLWNAADDWEELVYYTGTGFRLKGSTGVVPAYFTDSEIKFNTRLAVGNFPQSTTNTGEAWIGRANDRNTGTLTVQLGGNSASSRSFEVVDYAWSTVMFSVNSDNTVSVNNYLQAGNSLRAPIFYDSNDTGYYLDPNGTSNLLQLTTATRARWNMPRVWYDRSSRTSDQGYWTGTNGWGTEDGTWSNAWKGGFSGWDIWGTGTDHPQGGGYIHAQGIVSGQHYATSSVGYGWMMVGAHNAAENRYWLRGKWDTTTSSWVEMITTGNIGSQSVSYASSAGSVAWNNVTSKPSLDYQQEYTFTAPASTDGSGYSWVRVSMGGFNAGGDFVRFSIARAIGWNGASPYGGPSMDVVAYSREWHGGQEGAVITYAEHGSVPGSGWVTNAGPRDLAGGGYWFYMRIWGGVDYAMRVYRGSGPIGTDWVETSDPGSVYKVKLGVNNIGAQHTGFTTNGQMRSDIYYDYNDEGYYGDFNSRSVLNSLQLGTASSDTTNLKLDVQGHMAIRGTNGLYFGVSTNNYNSWTTKIYASGSTQYFNAQQFIFDNQGYGSQTFASFSSQEALFRTYPSDLNYKISIIGGDQFNAYYGSGAATLYLQYHGGSGGALNVANGKLTVNTAGSVVASGDMRAPIFYDSNDTGYYGNFAGFSRLSEAGITNTYTYNYFNVESSRAVAEFGHVGMFRSTQSATTDYIPFSFQSQYGNHSWGQVARFHIEQAGADRPSIQFSSGSSNTRWNIGYCYSDDNFRISQNMGYRPDLSGTYDSWGTERFRINTDGSIYVDGLLQSASSLRAPIFYDSQNTGYYLDPNSTSNIVTLYAGTLYGSDVYTNGGWFRNHSNNNGIYWSGTGWHLMPENGADFRFHSGSNSDSAIRMETNGTTRGYVYANSSNEIGFLNNGRSWRLRVYSDGAVESYGDFRAPIFYDSNDTAFYVDPNSSSRVRNLYVGDSGSNWVDTGGWGTQFHVSNGPHSILKVFARNEGIETGLFSHVGGQSKVGSFSNHDFSVVRNWDNRMTFYSGYTYANGYLQAADSLRAPIFYDSNDTTYFLDPNADFAMRVYGEICNSNYAEGKMQPGALNIGRTDTNYAWDGGSWAGDVRLGILANTSETWEFGIHDSGDSVMSVVHFDGGSTLTMGRNLGWGQCVVNAPAGYVSNSNPWGTANSAYFPNGITTAGGTNWIYGFTYIGNAPSNGSGHEFTTSGTQYSTGSITTPLFLVNNHSDNTKGYRIHNTSGSSVSAMFVNSSNQLVIAAGAVDQINLNKKVYVNGVALGVNVAPSATAGRIDASNDIVAYSSSDERLKYNISPIENALDKVKSLTGVEFDWKPEYKHAHGYEGHDTGIIAQQVEAVMPSAVRTNDTGFLAVRYEKLIGLLIEGMKEQQAQIDELKAKLDGLTK